MALELGPGPKHPAHLVAGVHGQPHRAGRVVDPPPDGLADPPGGIGRELEAAAPVELVHRVHQAQVALLDQIQDRHLRRLVLLGDGDHQPQVGVDERLGGRPSRPLGPSQFPLASGKRRAPLSSSAAACRPASMAWASRVSSSLVSNGYLPMPSRYSRTASWSAASARAFGMFRTTHRSGLVMPDLASICLWQTA